MNNNEFKEIEKNVEKQIENDGIADKPVDKEPKEKQSVSVKSVNTNWFKKNYKNLITVGIFVASLCVACSSLKKTNTTDVDPTTISVTTEPTTDTTNPTDSTVALDEKEEFESNPKYGYIKTADKLTAENIDEMVQVILEDNQSKGLNIDPTFIRSALFITNIDHLDQDDIKKMWKNNDLNIMEEITNMYNYTSAVGTHNNNIALGQKEGQYIALSNLAFDSEDRTILRELDAEFVDLVNGLNKDMTSEEYQQSFKYITEFYTGFGYLNTGDEQYSNYSLTSGGGLLSEQYWPMFSIVYGESEFITDENKVDIHTLTYGNSEGDDATLNGHKYLPAIVNHESLNCLGEEEKTLTKTQ